MTATAVDGRMEIGMKTTVVGQRMGNWIARSEPYVPPQKDRLHVDVVCLCGHKTMRRYADLRSGKSKMCHDCYTKEARSKVTPEEILINLVYGWYKKSAKERGIEWDLSKDKFAELIFNNCYICGSEPKNKASDRYSRVQLPKYNGIDRIVNALGYIEGNIEPCCRWCNEAKKAKSVEEFNEWIEGIMQTYGAKN